MSIEYLAEKQSNNPCYARPAITLLLCSLTLVLVQFPCSIRMNNPQTLLPRKLKGILSVFFVLFCLNLFILVLVALGLRCCEQAFSICG